METYLKLRRKEQRFVDEYVDCGIGAEAVRRIWPARVRPQNVAGKLMARPEIRLAVDERTAVAITEAGARLAIVIRGVCHRASADRTKIFETDGSLRPLDKWPQEVLDSIEGLEFENGKLSKVRTSSRNEASRLLMQYMGVLTEKHEHTGKGGAPLTPPVFNFGFGNGGPGQSTNTRPEGS